MVTIWTNPESATARFVKTGATTSSQFMNNNDDLRQNFENRTLVYR